MNERFLPTISVIIPARNEQVNFKRLLPSLAKQTYPSNKIEYIIVDDGSIDDTGKLAREFGAKVIKVKTGDIELNKGIGMHAAKNDLIYWFDADMEVIPNNLFQWLVKPLVEDPSISGSYASFKINAKFKVNSLVRFLSFDAIHRDPLFQFLVPSIESTIVEKRSGYYVCEYNPGRMPSSGMMMYWRKQLLDTEVGKNRSYLDLESLEIMVRAGFRRYAYVPEAKIIHHHVKSLSQLLNKRIRNLNRDYLPNIESKYFTWLDTSNPKEIIKLVGWVIYVNLFFPELIRGMVKMIRHRDIAALWQPIVSMTTTDIVLLGILSKPSGRKFLLRLLKRFIGR